MAITYTWNIESVSVLQTPDPDFVSIAKWLCSGTDGTNTAEIGGSSTFTTQEGAFVPYANLTEAVVLEWVEEELGENGVSGAEGCVAGQLNSIINPPASPAPAPLPW